VPELPEAETIVRTLALHIEGRRIVGAGFLTARVSPSEVPELAGRTVHRVLRYGKQVVFALDDGFLVVELRMTGLLLWREAAGSHARAFFRFRSGTVWFDDIRQFGTVRWREAFPDHLGPEPPAIEERDFARLLHGRGRRLKPLLTDQHFLRGLGNIYADEILFRAGLDPRTRAGDVGGRARRLHTAMRETLEEAIQAGGSTIRDFRDADGRPGRFQLQHRVYGKTGKACPTCGTLIERILVGQRGTHYCPLCQTV